MYSVIILKKRWERKCGVTTTCLFEADDIGKSTNGVIFRLPALAHKIIMSEKIFLSCFTLILPFEIFFNKLYFFLVAHAYQKLTDTLEWLSLKRPDTLLTLSVDACISSEARIKIHYLTSTDLQKTNTRQNNMVKISIAQARMAPMIYTPSTRQYLIGRYYFTA